MIDNRSYVCTDNDLGRLTATETSDFILKDLRDRSVRFAKGKVTALRSFLRYLYLAGETTVDLAVSVPTAAGWRLASLPKFVAPEDVRQLLRSCDRRTHVGCRDYAVLLMMVRLGLRAFEIAALELEDFDWTCGEIMVHGKGGQTDRLPLPEDVGKALAAYLRQRRSKAACRNVFVRARAPEGGVSSRAVQGIVRSASQRAGLAPMGSHRLRHTAATSMLRGGASLSEIAQVLRHRHVDTTAIYAKVDRASLRELAQPWPGGEA